MVHLLALPGSPQYGGSVGEVIETAAEDARILVDGGFPALIVENFGDVPFFADEVPAETVAAMGIYPGACVARWEGRNTGYL
jgi:predicted TIM-barrel enzyme